MPPEQITHWNLISIHRKALAACIAAGVAVAVVAFALVPREWESVSYVQVPHWTDLTPVEAVEQSWLRLVNPAFVTRALKQCGEIDWLGKVLSREYGGTGSRYDVQPVFKTEIIRLKMRHFEQERLERVSQCMADLALLELNGYAQTQLGGRIASARGGPLFRRKDLAGSDGRWIEPAPGILPAATLGPAFIIRWPVSPRPVLYLAMGICLGLVMFVCYLVTPWRRRQTAG
jgi:hypothetical protein